MVGRTEHTQIFDLEFDVGYVLKINTLLHFQITGFRITWYHDNPQYQSRIVLLLDVDENLSFRSPQEM